MQNRYEKRNAQADQGRAGLSAGSGTKHCDIGKITTALRGTAAGATFSLTQQMTNCDYFLPLCFRLWVLDAAAPTTVRIAEIQQVKIGACDQECGSTTPAVASTSMVGISPDYSGTDDWCGVPVCWGIFSQGNLNKSLIVGGVNIDVATFDLYSTVFGNPCASPPPGCPVGRPFASAMA